MRDADRVAFKLVPGVLDQRFEVGAVGFRQLGHSFVEEAEFDVVAQFGEAVEDCVVERQGVEQS